MHGFEAPPLSPILTDVATSPRAALECVASLGFRWVQLCATQPGLRPRELDRSGRRDLRATLCRYGLAPSGLDCWIPPEHYTDPGLADRAATALLATVELAGELGQLPVSVRFPADGADELLDAIAAQAARWSVRVADHDLERIERPAPDPIGLGVDPVAWLASEIDPVAGVLRGGALLVSARLSDLRRGGGRCAIGEADDGRLDVNGYRAALLGADYRAPVVVDTRGWIDPVTGLRRTKERWEADLLPA
jgi:sugar phosphate isomerase/epimerase